MRRLYVLPKAVLMGKIQTGVEFASAIAATTSEGVAITTVPDGRPVLIDVAQLFHPLIGSHYIDLPGGMVLLVTSFTHSEAAEDLFHALPDVAILPNPTLDGNKPLTAHVGADGYKFAQKHLKALTDSPEIGALPGDSVLDLAKKAQAIHPLVKFRHTL